VVVWVRLEATEALDRDRLWVAPLLSDTLSDMVGVRSTFGKRQTELSIGVSS